MRKSTAILFYLVCFLPSFIFAQSNKSDLYLQTSEMNDIMVHYRADREVLMRFYNTSSNTGDWWDRTEPGLNSPERRARIMKLIEDYSDQLKKQDFESWSVNGKVDYILFKRDLEDDQYQLKQQEKEYQKIVSWLPFSDRIYELEKPRRRGVAVVGQDVAKEMEAIRKLVWKYSDSLKASKITFDITTAKVGADAIRSMQGLIKNYFNFYNEYDPLFTWWVPKTYEGLDSALKVYQTVFKDKGKVTSSQKDDGSGIVGVPIGREELIRQLKLEFIPYSPEELVDIANKEFAWCDVELLKASREMGFGDNWKAAQEKVKNSYVEPGRQPEAMFKLYNESVDFLKKNDLITIPPIAEEGWRMYMMSAERQLVNPFFLGGESLIISYPTNTMTYDDKLMSMRGNNPHFSRATIHHELIAGHHLQQFMSDRYKTYRNFGTPFWVEGNSLYWELLLWDLKFPQSPEDRIGMLFWRMHRCARIIFSLNYHLGKWTPQQCIDFLVDRVGHERANAEGEVRRSFVGGYSPLYQIAYMIGGLQFYALKKELVDSKKLTYKQYHDAILHENQLPIEMLRAILTNQSLSRDFQTKWKFYSK